MVLWASIDSRVKEEFDDYEEEDAEDLGLQWDNKEGRRRTLMETMGVCLS